MVFKKKKKENIFENFRDNSDLTDKILDTLEWILFNKKDLDELIINKNLDSNGLNLNLSNIEKYDYFSRSFGEYFLYKEEKFRIYKSSFNEIKDSGYKYILKKYKEIIFKYELNENLDRFIDPEIQIYVNYLEIKNFMRLFGK